MIAKYLHSLTDLNLDGCKGITDTGLQYLSSLSALAQLSLSGCDKLTCAGLENLYNLLKVR
jgi:hypothetical protein